MKYNGEKVTEEFVTKIAPKVAYRFIGIQDIIAVLQASDEVWQEMNFIKEEKKDMSQERTKQRDRAEDKKLIEDIQAAYGNERGRTFVTRAAQAMEDYMAEIDRLNAVIDMRAEEYLKVYVDRDSKAESIRDLTAKVQERDKELASWRKWKEIQLLAAEQDEDSKSMAIAREGRLLVEERDKEIERLRAALAWYAEPMHYIKQIGLDHGFQREFQPRVNSDQGKRAQTALKGAE